MPAEITMTDTRSIRIPVPADGPTSEKFADFLTKAVDDGYAIESATVLCGGDQREPYVVGVKITLSR